MKAACGLTNLTSAHHIRVLSQEIHNFSFPLISPLSAQHHGHLVAHWWSRGSSCVVWGCGRFLVPTFRHFRNVLWFSVLERLFHTVPWCRLSCTVNGLRTKDRWEAEELPPVPAITAAHAHRYLKGRTGKPEEEPVRKLTTPFHASYLAFIYVKFNQFHVDVNICCVWVFTWGSTSLCRRHKVRRPLYFSYLRRHTHYSEGVFLSPKRSSWGATPGFTFALCTWPPRRRYHLGYILYVKCTLCTLRYWVIRNSEDSCGWEIKWIMRLRKNGFLKFCTQEWLWSSVVPYIYICYAIYFPLASFYCDIPIVK